ncbi:MAG: ribonuclease PH [Chloroflexi bacterium]|nr:ribonuclease PH [Chloroflexota bacterium]
MRADGRENDQLRPVVIKPNYLDYAEGSALIQMGHTWVLCAASIEDEVPLWLRGQAQGWVTAEYDMLPRSTRQRTPRSRTAMEMRGRTQEIQRFIGRSLRASLDLRKLGERTILVDCDVIQADGGTRTAAITGGYVALALALKKLILNGQLRRDVIRAPVAAVSVGVVQDELLLDLCYAEDAQAEVDFNVVMTARGLFVEVQGTAEGRPFSRDTLEELLALAEKGIQDLFAAQRQVLEGK